MGRNNAMGIIGSGWREGSWIIFCCVSCALYDVQQHPWLLLIRNISPKFWQQNTFRHYQMSSKRQREQNCPWLRMIALKIVMFQGRCINRANNQGCFLDSGQQGWWQGIWVGGWNQMYLMKLISKPDKKTSMGNSFLSLFHPPFPLYSSPLRPSPVNSSEIQKLYVWGLALGSLQHVVVLRLPVVHPDPEAERLYGGSVSRILGRPSKATRGAGYW